jgi:hypothetical protein
MDLRGAGGVYVFRFPSDKPAMPGREVARGIVPHLDADGRLVRLVVYGPGAASLLITDAGSDVTAVPRLEVDSGQAIVALVLANGASSEVLVVWSVADRSTSEPYAGEFTVDGVWLRTDADGLPLRVVFEVAPVGVGGLVDLVIHWRSLGLSSEEMSLD